MSEQKPQVKKRLYTQLMDIYRHNDIYLPGFNTVTRSLLKMKAEGAFSTISAKGKEREKEVAAWFDSHKFFFGYGVFRSGTTFLADFLNRHAKQSIVMHEANVNDYWFYTKAMQSDAAAIHYIKDYRLPEIHFRMKNESFSIYGEINPFLRRHCAAIKTVFPEAKQFQIVRDPRDVLRSLMSRELFDRKDPMGKIIFPPKEDDFLEEWPNMNRFEKLCWLWAADNRFIRENTNHVIQFENLRKDFDYFNQNVLQFLGLEMDADDWHGEIDKVYNSTPRYTFPKFPEWSAENKRSFERICGKEMAVYGY